MNARELLKALPDSIQEVEVVGDGPWVVRLPDETPARRCEVTVEEAAKGIAYAAVVVMLRTSGGAR